jgi:hypothetical protein
MVVEALSPIAAPHGEPCGHPRLAERGCQFLRAPVQKGDAPLRIDDDECVGDGIQDAANLLLAAREHLGAHEDACIGRRRGARQRGADGCLHGHVLQEELDCGQAAAPLL